MARFNQMVQIHTGAAQPASHGDLVVTPISKAVVIRFPIGIFVWNRPVAVRVESPRGTERIPIKDITLLAQVSLLALSWLALVFVLARRRRHS